MVAKRISHDYDFGMNMEDLTLCALRYCLGKNIPYVWEICHHMVENWDMFPALYRIMIMDDIRDYLESCEFNMSRIDNIKWNAFLIWAENQ